MATAQRELLTYPTWERYTVLSRAIAGMTTRERRQIFTIVRAAGTTSPDLFFPGSGFTLAEFAVWYTLGDTTRRRSRRKRARASPGGHGAEPPPPRDAACA